MWRDGLHALLLLLGAHGIALAQDWPSKPVRISVPVTPGSAIDLVCRTVYDQLTQQLGQPFIIENGGGGGGTLAPAAVAKAEPDGYALLSHSSALTIFPATHATLPFDPERDFTGVVALVNTPFLLVVSPQRYQTIRDLVATAKAKPGALNYASVGHGGAAHINAERFRLSAGIEKLYVETSKALKIRSVQDKLNALGGAPIEMTSAEFDGFFRDQIKQNRELVKAAGIQPN